MNKYDLLLNLQIIKNWTIILVNFFNLLVCCPKLFSSFIQFVVVMEGGKKWSIWTLEMIGLAMVGGKVYKKEIWCLINRVTTYFV